MKNVAYILFEKESLLSSFTEFVKLFSGETFFFYELNSPVIFSRKNMKLLKACNNFFEKSFRVTVFIHVYFFWSFIC